MTVMQKAQAIVNKRADQHSSYATALGAKPKPKAEPKTFQLRTRDTANKEAWSDISEEPEDDEDKMENDETTEEDKKPSAFGNYLERCKHEQQILNEGVDDETAGDFSDEDSQMPPTTPPRNSTN
jgi:hypothetical protein